MQNKSVHVQVITTYTCNYILLIITILLIHVPFQIFFRYIALQCLQNAESPETLIVLHEHALLGTPLIELFVFHRLSYVHV